jgi:acyl-CoA synthetase (AMP-forming)/AMP-acid ligase II
MSTNAGLQGFAIVSTEQLPVELTLSAALDRAAERCPDQVGWVFDDERVTFSQMRERSEIIRAALQDIDVGRRDVVALWLPNAPEWAYTFFAAARLGAVVMSMNTRWAVPEAQYAIANSAAKALVFRDRFLRLDFASMVAEMVPELAPAIAGLPRVAGGESYLVALPPTAGRHDARRVGALLESAAGREPAPSTNVSTGVWPGDPLLIQYTSGSTAAPKGAVLSHRHVLNFSIELTLRLGVGFGESMLNTQPVYHVGGACGAVPVPLTVGCTMVMPEFYAPERVLALIERERCVARTGMSTMYVREMALPNFADYDTSSLRSGWTIAPPGVMDRIRAEFPLEGLIQLYGSSEVGSTAGRLDDPWSVRRRSAGAPVAGTEISIVDPGTGSEQARGEVGEILFRGWSQLLGYIADEVGPRADSAIDDRGWFHTGDLGSLDSDGRLYFEGRLKDMIKPGGENVSAQEVEAVISTDERVEQVAVIGVPDADLGEAVMAIVVPAPGVSLTGEDVRTFCAGKLARFRIPTHVRIISEMPLTDSGKIKKLDLQRQFATEFALELT